MATLYPPPQPTPQFLKRYTRKVYNQVHNHGPAPLSPQYASQAFDGCSEDSSITLQVRFDLFDDFSSDFFTSSSVGSEMEDEKWNENRENLSREGKERLLRVKINSFHSTNHENFSLKI